jgi:hypothetical protein
VIFVKRGCATDASVFRHMLARVLFKMLCALNAREECGSMVSFQSVCTCLHFDVCVLVYVFADF